MDRDKSAHETWRVKCNLAQLFDLVAEKSEAEGQRRLPRIKIDNPAADSELSTSGDLRDAFITTGRESFEKLFHPGGRSASELNNRRFKASAFRRSLIETCACRHDDPRAGVAFDLQKQRQPFRCYFRIC